MSSIICEVVACPFARIRFSYSRCNLISAGWRNINKPFQWTNQLLHVVIIWGTVALWGSACLFSCIYLFAWRKNSQIICIDVFITVIHLFIISFSPFAVLTQYHTHKSMNHTQLWVNNLKKPNNNCNVYTITSPNFSVRLKQNSIFFIPKIQTILRLNTTTAVVMIDVSEFGR